MAKRRQNEQRYDHWESLPDGGRRYWYDVPGEARGFARYVKIVDAQERTVQFFQEIYDDNGRLIETHQKFPVDSGHQFAERASEE